MLFVYLNASDLKVSDVTRSSIASLMGAYLSYMGHGLSGVQFLSPEPQSVIILFPSVAVINSLIVSSGLSLSGNCFYYN